MYKNILVTLDATPTDRAIIDHVKELAAKMSSSVVLLHVATGVSAQFHGPNAGGQEVEEDEAYLKRVQAEFETVGIPVRAELAFGDPVREIVKWDYELRNPAQAGAVVARAVEAAMAPPRGPVYLMLPREPLSAVANGVP